MAVEAFEKILLVANLELVVCEVETAERLGRAKRVQAQRVGVLQLDKRSEAEVHRDNDPQVPFEPVRHLGV